MKSLFIQKIAFLSLFLIIVSNDAHTQNRSITFVEGSWTEVLEKAAESDKLIFLDAYTTWCGPCKKLAKNIFTLDEVADFYNENFICAHFDMEKDEGIGMAKKYKVRAYPSLLFIDAEGRCVHRFVGAPNQGEKLIEIGKTALNPAERLAYFEDQYKGGNLDGALINKYLNSLTTAYIPKDPILNKYFATQEESDLSSRDNWEIIYNHVGKINSREFKYLLDHQDEFISKYTEDSVTNKIYALFLQQSFKLIYAKEFDKHKYESLKNKIRNSNFKLTDQLIVTADLRYYERNKKWKDYINLSKDNVDKYYFDDYMTLNNIAWDFYENSKKKENLEKAEKWAKRSVELESKSFNNDTYAAIMFKLGKKDEAIEIQEFALKLAREEGRSVKSYEESLARMKK